MTEIIRASASRQPAGAPSGLSPQAVSSKAAHQAQDAPLTLVAELARVQAFFQLRSICLHMGVQPPASMEDGE